MALHHCHLYINGQFQMTVETSDQKVKTGATLDTTRGSFQIDRIWQTVEQSHWMDVTRVLPDVSEYITDALQASQPLSQAQLVREVFNQVPGIDTRLDAKTAVDLAIGNLITDGQVELYDNIDNCYQLV